MERNEVIRILLTDERISHGFASGKAGTGVELISGRGPRTGEIGAQVTYCGQVPPEQKEYWCRLHVERLMKRRLLFMKSLSAVNLSIIYPKKAGARLSVGGYGVHVPTSDAQAIEQAIMGDPMILLELFEKVFPKDFATENKGHELKLDPAWDKNVKVKVY